MQLTKVNYIYTKINFKEFKMSNILSVKEVAGKLGIIYQHALPLMKYGAIPEITQKGSAYYAYENYLYAWVNSRQKYFPKLDKKWLRRFEAKSDAESSEVTTN